MLFRRFVLAVLIRAAQNPAIQKKAGEMTGKTFKQATPLLLRASRRAGELSRKVKQKMLDAKNQRLG